ncbi:4-oxalomesaconate tautomerase [mine drainage metagenome]|uniref:4-oxalomesaconate tautomerase n=1 Tax=mine drainage metagenome TaxID=410659 RepID=A0A1J5QHT5_9ZZZZ
MRGGTSKGLYFLASDLPSDRSTRDAVLLAALGSPDPREIDGMGGGHPLTSKVAVIKKSDRPDTDIDYLFLQVWPDRAEVSDQQNCGNILAGVAPFAIEQGLIAAGDEVTSVRIWLENTDSIATSHVQTPNKQVRYDGTARIDGVPNSHAPISIDFEDVAGSSCGALLPTGNAVDEIAGVQVTCIDNGMPVVCLKASDFGFSGNETPTEIEADLAARARIESIRLAAGVLMNLGDVTGKTIPKMSLLSAPTSGGAISTRTLIPHRVHEAIGVLGAVSVATACLVPGSVAESICEMDPTMKTPTLVEVEHPTGFFTVSLDVQISDGTVQVKKSALLRTARLLMRGDVYVPASVWSGK